MALAIPEVRIRRQVRLVYRKSGERSHAATAFLAIVEEKLTASKSDEGSKRRLAVAEA